MDKIDQHTLRSSTGTRLHALKARFRTAKRWRRSWLVPILIGVASVLAYLVPSVRALVSNVSYVRNCAEARQLGVAPILLGAPAYREELDADRDGVACEPYW